ncbi:hypothetical protein CSIM01_06753 [Colletotrichum simmondsii]|uniref:Uncharacterized protein n=1 Tax=Colletotrichum simmondsii TaxID=703756 RepID=A0A135RVZ1_9PEZI|nr:hypothetical protein CSIM01_06753 [Colletotrichum simmondsii]
MMMNNKKSQRKTYFILRSTEYQPDDLIQLGQLIEDPRAPYEPLAPPMRPFPTNAVRVSHESNWSLTKSKGAARHNGVFAQFVSLITAETSIHESNETTRSWRAAQLETTSLGLGADKESDYVTASVQEAVVQKRLTREGFLKKLAVSKKVLYMITGIKIARRPGQVSYEVRKTAGIEAKLGADPGTGGLAMPGVQGGVTRFKSDVESSMPEEDFVFAYRLRKIHVNFSNNKALVGSVISGGELHGHGVGGVSDDTSSEEESDDETPDEVIAGVDELDIVLVENEDFGRSLPARDAKNTSFDEVDGEDCLVIVAD